MNELQKELLIFFKDVKQVLEDNDIEYYAMGGTAIGALRENGFIEWDDDIDIIIDITNFEKLKKVFSEKHEMSATFISGNQRYPWIKILKNDVDIMEGDLETKLFIDVFLGMPLAKNIKKLERKMAFKQVILDSKILTYKKIANTEGIIPAIFSKIYGWLFFWISSKRIWESLIKIIVKADVVDDNSFIYKWGKKGAQKFSVGKTQLVKFEDIEIPVTESYATDNKNIFGDIYEVPPVSDRVNHNIEIIRRVENDKERGE